MTDKLALLKALLPLAALKPLTQEAASALPPGQTCNGLVAIHSFPFRIGRESRLVRDSQTGRLLQLERPKMGDRDPTNELYLLDLGQQLNISREHLQISRNASGFILTDRGSACGCAVGHERLGGRDKGGHTFLADGDTIILGAENSPFQYRFVDLSDAAISVDDLHNSLLHNRRRTAYRYSEVRLVPE